MVGAPPHPAQDAINRVPMALDIAALVHTLTARKSNTHLYQVFQCFKCFSVSVFQHYSGTFPEKGPPILTGKLSSLDGGQTSVNGSGHVLKMSQSQMTG